MFYRIGMIGVLIVAALKYGCNIEDGYNAFISSFVKVLMF
jgi:hypothetical protein